jgi:hypothetical protein
LAVLAIFKTKGAAGSVAGGSVAAGSVAGAAVLGDSVAAGGSVAATPPPHALRNIESRTIKDTNRLKRFIVPLHGMEIVMTSYHAGFAKFADFGVGLLL